MLRPGANVVGPFEAELGNGETARQVVAGLRAAGMPVLPVGFVATASRQGHAFAHVAEPAGLFPQTVLCANAPQVPQLAPAYRATRVTGVWWWEVDPLPAWMAESFAHVDEVWTGSDYVARILDAAAPPGVPVRKVDFPVAVPAPPPRSRAALGLPEGFVVLYLYDYNSILARKNPLGAIEAFRRAFPAPGAAHLVLKSINGDRHPDALAQVTAAAAGREDVHVVDRYVDAAERDALLAACDAYLSPHRAEGFGLTLAEAMGLGRPVIATAGTGADEFLDEAVGFPVRGAPAPVGPGADPYPADATWTAPDLDHAAAQLRAVVEHPEEAARR
ncbi:MAG: glycosyltransferase, partial [Solirubrobacterales bacterium]|nr:glycosyltransferase [Solirubrobacterales bacterium]